MTTYIIDSGLVKIISIKGQKQFLDWSIWWTISMGHHLLSDTLLSPDVVSHFIPPTLGSRNRESSMAHFYQILYFVTSFTF